VLKILMLSPRARPGARQRFEREAAVLSSLSHPNLVRARGLWDEGAASFIVLDRVPGRSLLEELRAHGNSDRSGRPASPRELQRLVRQLASALGACHDAGVVHRDVKPANILAVRDRRRELRRAVLVDFGVARLVDVPASDATTVGRILGTPRYAAPEQLDGQPVTPSTDLYALAVVVYELATRRRPWLRDARGEAARFGPPGDEPPGNDRAAVVARIRHGDVPPPSRYRPELAPLDAWFLRTLSARSSDRPPTAADFAASFAPRCAEVEALAPDRTDERPPPRSVRAPRSDAGSRRTRKTRPDGRRGRASGRERRSPRPATTRRLVVAVAVLAVALVGSIAYRSAARRGPPRRAAPAVRPAARPVATPPAERSPTGTPPPGGAHLPPRPAPSVLGAPIGPRMPPRSGAPARPRADPGP